MASTAAGRRLTEAHRLAQARLSAETVVALVRIWPLVDPNDIDGTVDRWLTAARPLVRQQRTKSIRLAKAYQSRFRAVELDTDPAELPIPDPPELDLAALSTSLLTQGPVRMKALIGSGRTVQEAAQAASVFQAAAGTRHALNGGRETIFAATEADPAARGIRRVTSANCCAFCAMLAARSADGLSAEFFKAHDNCNCQPETAYQGGVQDATRQAKEFNALYRESQDQRDGGTALDAFRRALEAQRQGA